MKVVGLTGGIATGKSTVGRLLRERGVPVIDADAVSREIVEPGQPALRQIVDLFGLEALAPDGSLDRAAMRRRVAHDPEARRQLEAITHPAIRQRIAERLLDLASEGHPAVVVEAALLVETGGYRGYPELIVVTCDPATQLRRLLARDGTSREDAEALIGSQLPLADKEKVATRLIRNDGDLEALRAQTNTAWEALLAS